MSRRKCSTSKIFPKRLARQISFASEGPKKVKITNAPRRTTMALFSNDSNGPPIPTYDEAISHDTSQGRSRFATSAMSPLTSEPPTPMAEGYYAPDHDHESRSLLRRPHQRSGSTAADPTNSSGSGSSQTRSRPQSRPQTYTGGYRPPTVETDDEGEDEDSIWSSTDSEHGRSMDGGRMMGAEEEAHVRREMQELEMEDPLDGPDGAGRRGRSSLFGKAIGFTMSLPRWKWNWRLPQWRRPQGFQQVPGHDSAGHDTADPEAGMIAGGGPTETGAATATATGTATSTTTTTTPRRRCWSLWKKPPPTIALIVLGRVIALFVVLGFVYLVFMSDLFKNLSRRLGSQVFDPESVRIHIQDSVEPARMRELARHFSSYAHMAGTEGDFALAVDVKNLFETYGLEDVHVDEYYAYLNYPTKDGRGVEILNADGTVNWAAQLDAEPPLAESPGHLTYTFHGLSQAGDVRGPLVYAHYGSQEDFKTLRDKGVKTEGAIALIRNHGNPTSTGLKVKAAEEVGFAGCLLYSDPADVGGDLPADAVPRSSVGLTGWILGDVLTPGWESKKGLPRMDPAAAPGLVRIPSLPLAYRDAEVLLQRLKGAGQKAPDNWKGSLKGVDEWWLGDGGAASPTVHLRNEQDAVKDQPIWNVYGRVVGVEQPEKRVFIGNRRDAWTAGASDPHSGTAVMLELARIFGDLLERGWRPLRTIEFMSWDGGAYNLIGSSEYVEANLDALRGDAVAYINLDDAVTGSDLHAAASPVFSKLLVQAMKRVADPHTNSSLFERWVDRAAVLEFPSAASDYAAFQSLAGVSSLDVRFSPDPQTRPARGPVSATAYDTFDQLEQKIDPGFVYHGMLAQLVGLLTVELADRPILPLDLPAYADALVSWGKDLVAWVQGRAGTEHASLFTLEPVHTAIDGLMAAVREFQTWEVEWDHEVMAGSGWEPVGLGRQRTEYNSRMASFETNLLDLTVGGGIPNRTQFKHVLFGPKQWAFDQGELFPAIHDYVVADDWPNANATMARAAHIFNAAAANLVA